MQFPVTVELEINGVWTDVSDRVRRQPITIKRGREDEASRVQPSSATVLIQNRDGHLSPDNPESPWWPHIRRGMGVRVSVTDGANTYLRFTGDAVELAPVWVQPTQRDDDTTIPVMHMSITAAGLLRRLIQGNKPALSSLWRQIMSHEDDPRLVAYWPMEDGNSATHAQSPLVGVEPMLVAMDMGSDDSLPASKPLPHASTSQAWGFNAAVPAAQNGTWRVEWQLRVPEPPATGRARILEAKLAGASPFTSLVVAISATTLEIDAYVGDVLFGTSTGLIGTFYQDRWRFMRLGYGQSGTFASYSCTAFDALDGSVAAFAQSGSFSGGQVGHVARVQNLSLRQLPEGVSMGHVLVRTAPVNPIMVTTSANSAHIGEPAGERFLRLCAEDGITASAIGDETETEPMGPQLPLKLPSLLDECADAEQSLYFEAADATELRFRTFGSLLNQSPVVTLDMAQRQLAAPFEPVTGDKDIRNDITVSRPDGSEARATDEESIDAEGLYDDQVEVNVETDDQLIDQAAWRLFLGTWPEARHRNVNSNLRAAGPAVRAAWATADLGDLVAVRNLPRQHARDVDLLLQGHEETLDFFGWRVSGNTAPAGPYDVGVLDDDGAPPDTSLARLESDGSVLGEAIDETDTGFTVELLAESGETPVPWTTDSAYMPFGIEVGGEVMTVTAVAAAVGGDSLAGAGDAEDTTPTTSHVAPSVDAIDSGLLICAACSFIEPGTYTVPGSMTPGTQTVGEFSTLADATESVSSGATGTRSFTLDASDLWSAVSVVAHGAVVVEEVLSGIETSPTEAPDPVVLTTSDDTQEGWWLLAVHGWDWDPGNVMPPPDSDPDLWTLIADSQIASEDTSRVRVWARRVTEAGAQVVTLGAEADQFDNHGRLYVFSGVTGFAQAFTVIRSVNGVTKPHAAESAVVLADPLRLV